MKLDQWRIDYRPGGWVRAVNETGFSVFFQLRPDDSPEGGQRLRIRTAILDAPEPITARTWREAPFAGVENHALIPDVASILEGPAETGADGAAGLRRYFEESADRFPDSGVQLTALLIPDEGKPFRRVQAPEGHITDEFLENLAAAYRWAAAQSRAPAPVIAEMSGAPVRTVHRWVLMARKRGFLAPGIRGRTG